MTTLKRASESIVNMFHMKHDSISEESSGANCPEAIEARRKNRRVAK
jgi:hypothetical protein